MVVQFQIASSLEGSEGKKKVQILCSVYKVLHNLMLTFSSTLPLPTLQYSTYVLYKAFIIIPQTETHSSFNPYPSFSLFSFLSSWSIQSESHSVVSNSLHPHGLHLPPTPQAPLSMGILQARILEWVAMPSSRGSSQLRD